MKKDAGWQAEGTSLKLNLAQKKIHFDDAKSTAESDKNEFEEILAKKEKLTDQGRKLRLEIIGEIIEITEKAMEKT